VRVERGASVEGVQAMKGGGAVGLGEDADGRVETDWLDLVKRGRKAGGEPPAFRVLSRGLVDALRRIGWPCVHRVEGGAIGQCVVTPSGRVGERATVRASRRGPGPQRFGGCTPGAQPTIHP
jgi:hypothetical protein